MQLRIRLVTAVMLVMAVSFVSCKKTDTNPPATDQAADLTLHADDEARISGEIDAIANDANVAMESDAAFNGRIENTLGIICNATSVADSSGDIKRITVTYNGLNCELNANVTGVVVFSMLKGTYWKNTGAVLTVAIQNLKITRVLDNKSITINGTKTITNVSGGRLVDLASRGTITHTITANDLSITFDGDTQRMWQIAKKRVFTYNAGIVITTTGTHTEGATEGVAEWGTNRLGNAFVTAITQPMVIRQDCSFRLVSGEVTHTRMVADVAVKFGLNAAGEPTSCPVTGNYYLKLSWKAYNGETKSVILPY